MLDIKEINEVIDTLENSTNEWDIMQKLSMLYTVRTGFTKSDVLPISATHEEKQKDTNVNDTIIRVDVKESDSEFIKACDGVDYLKLLAIIDEHMTDIEALYPKVYNTILNRIKSLK